MKGAAASQNAPFIEHYQTGRVDAELLLDLLVKGEFPQVHRTSFESREILRLLRYRHRLVQMCIRCKNSLQALAFSAGSAKRAMLLSRKGRRCF